MSSKLREVLLKADVLISIATFEEGVKMDEVDKIRSEIKSALAEPLKNCEVGTAEEQEERYLRLKREYVDRMARCPAEGQSFFPDSLYWAQMPYESEVKR